MNIRNFPRAEKLSVVARLHLRLSDRKAKGPPEPGLDAYIDELDQVKTRLEAHVSGKTDADDARTAALDKVDLADDEVDTQMRKIEGLIGAEANRRQGPNVTSVRALYLAAFPKGLEPISGYVADQNVYCRETLRALRSPAHAETIAAIKLPPEWVDEFEVALKASDAAFDELTVIRGDKSAHVDLGKDTETAWVDLMVRLRHHIAGRARRDEVEKQIEGRRLLEPLLVAVQKMKTEARSRATRKANGATGPEGTATGATGVVNDAPNP